MNTIEKTYAHTEQLIAHALVLVKQLHGQIAQEADVLMDSTGAEAISQIAANKNGLVTQLDQFQSQLSQVLAEHQLPNTDAGVQSYFLKAQSAGFSIENASGQWAEIKALSSQCRILNEQNGMTINLLMLHTQRALQILKGQSPVCTTYGRDGAGQRDSFSHSLVSA